MAEFAFCYIVITVFCLTLAIVMLVRLNEGVASALELRYFRGMVVSFSVFCAGEILWAIGNFKLLPIPIPLLSLASMISMIAIGFVTYFWFSYGETKMGFFFLEKPLYRFLSLIPLIAAIVLYVLSPITGWMYYYDANGQFVQGPLYSLAVPLEQSYLLIISIHALVRGIRSTGEKRRECFSIFAFIIVPSLACIFDAFVPTMPVIAPAIFSSIFFVFLGLQESQVSNDSLTGLNNRRRAESYLDEMIAGATADKPFYVLMADINDFKQINDTYGHLEGDRALRIVADAVRQTCSDLRSFAARWGGDEFVIVAEGSRIHSATDLADSLKNNVKSACDAAGLDYELTVSAGYALCDRPSMTKHRLQKQADEMLYEEKERFHAQHGEAAAASA